MHSQTLRTLLLIAAAGFAAAACTPEQTPTDQPPEPKAVVAAHSQLSDTIRQPIDQAKAVEGMVSDAAERQKAAIDAAAH